MQKCVSVWQLRLTYCPQSSEQEQISPIYLRLIKTSVPLQPAGCGVILFLYDVEAQSCFHLYNTAVVLEIQTWEQIVWRDAKGNWIFHFRKQGKEDGDEIKKLSQQSKRVGESQKKLSQRWASESSFCCKRTTAFCKISSASLQNIVSKNGFTWWRVSMSRQTTLLLLKLLKNESTDIGLCGLLSSFVNI